VSEQLEQGDEAMQVGPYKRSPDKRMGEGQSKVLGRAVNPLAVMAAGRFDSCLTHIWNIAAITQ
jgi:hypothetical protein